MNLIFSYLKRIAKLRIPISLGVANFSFTNFDCNNIFSSSLSTLVIMQVSPSCIFIDHNILEEIHSSYHCFQQFIGT